MCQRERFTAIPSQTPVFPLPFKVKKRLEVIYSRSIRFNYNKKLLFPVALTEYMKPALYSIKEVCLAPNYGGFSDLNSLGLAPSRNFLFKLNHDRNRKESVCVKKGQVQGVLWLCNDLLITEPTLKSASRSHELITFHEAPPLQHHTGD